MGRPKLDRPNYKFEPNEFGIWELRWTENRKPRSWSSRTRDAKEAHIRRDQYLALKDAPSLAGEPTVSAILDHYLADKLGNVAAYDTLVHACKPLRRHLGNLLPNQIFRKLYWDRRKRDLWRGKHPSAGTIIREGVTLRAAFELAVADKLIDRNSIPAISLPQAPGPRIKWLTPAQALALLTATRQRHIRLFISLGLATGGRKEALESLTWGQVDFLHGTISLELPGRATSNKRRATVPMSDEIRIALEEAYKLKTCDYVIERASKMVGDVKKGFGNAARRAGLECTPHILRHTCATWQVMRGVPVAEIARFLGDSEKMVEKVYGKHSPEYLRRAARATEFVWESLAKEITKREQTPISQHETVG